MEAFFARKISGPSIPLQCCKDPRKRVDGAEPYGFVDSLVYIIAEILTRCTETLSSARLASKNAVITK